MVLNSEKLNCRQGAVFLYFLVGGGGARGEVSGLGGGVKHI